MLTHRTTLIRLATLALTVGCSEAADSSVATSEGDGSSAGSEGAGAGFAGEVPTKSELFAALARVFCTAVLDCGERVPRDLAYCEAQYLETSNGVYSDAYVIVPDAARSCVAALSAVTDCASLGDVVLTSECDRALVGTLPLGAPCVGYRACEPGLRCERQDCPGVCVENPAPPGLELGASCSSEGGAECGPRLLCDDGAFGTQTCREVAEVFLMSGEGEPCSSSDFCQLGLYCDEATSRCQPELGPGSPCSTDDECQPGHTCPWLDDGPNQVCTPRVPLGSACEDLSSCDEGYCQGGICVLPALLGEACTENVDCNLQFCSAGECASPPQCHDPYAVQ